MKREAMHVLDQGVYGKSLYFIQFYCDSKTALKRKIILIKKNV